VFNKKILEAFNYIFYYFLGAFDYIEKYIIFLFKAFDFVELYFNFFKEQFDYIEKQNIFCWKLFPALRTRYFLDFGCGGEAAAAKIKKMSSNRSEKEK
jgi:hypothetical protein